MTFERISSCRMQKKLQNPFACNADQHFNMKVKCLTGRASFWVKFPAVQKKTPVQYPGGGGGCVGTIWN